MKNKGLIAKEGRIYLDVFHEGETLTFVRFCTGPNTYVEVGEQIEAQNLRKPTFAEITSLAYAAFKNLDNKYSKKIIQTLKDGWFWGFNGILYAPNEGVYIQNLPKVVNGRVSMDKSDLVKRLEAKDHSVRFAPFGFKTGEQEARGLAKNEFVIALVGEEGADKLAEMSGNYPKKPQVWSFDNVNNEQVSVPALDEYYLGDRLIVNGLNCVGDRGGYAFGVFETKKLA
ncbi:MAG: hypothetical protein Q8L29_02600 [archaeon]|nr:hypothetical protein [archaeon]